MAPSPEQHRSNDPTPVAANVSRRHPGGVTVPELLVGVVIVCVLVAIAAPAFVNIRRKAASGKCAANLRQLGAAVYLYAAEKNGRFPPASSSPENRLWYQFLQDSNVPYDRKGVLPNANYKNQPDVLTVYNCPVNPYRTDEWKTPSYAYNSALGKDHNRVTISSIPYPEKTVMFVDAGYRRESTRAPAQGPPKVLCYLTGISGTFGWEKSFNFEVHQGRTNVLMIDGHLEALSREEVARRSVDKTLLWSPDNTPSALW